MPLHYLYGYCKRFIMASRAETIRVAVYDKIVADKATYAITDFDVEQTYYPNENLADLATRPKIKVVTVGPDAIRDRQLRNPVMVLLQLPVQVCIQQQVTPTDTDTIDDLVELVEDIMDDLEDDELVTDYRWQRTEALKDENNLPYSYEQLTQEGVFNAIFTVFYQHIKQ
jgi:hypothetical protein